MGPSILAHCWLIWTKTPPIHTQEHTKISVKVVYTLQRLFTTLIQYQTKDIKLKWGIQFIENSGQHIWPQSVKTTQTASAYTQTHTHTHRHTHTHTLTPTPTHTHTRTHTLTQTHTYKHTHTHTHIHKHAHIHTYIRTALLIESLPGPGCN